MKDQVVAPSRTIVVHAAAGENVRRVRCVRQGRARRYASASWCRTVTLGWLLQTPHAAQCQRPLLCEGAPLSREAVAQQDVRGGGPAPGTASLSARQEVPEVEAPVHPAPHQAQQGAQEEKPMGAALSFLGQKLFASSTLIRSVKTSPAALRRAVQPPSSAERAGS